MCRNLKRYQRHLNLLDFIRHITILTLYLPQDPALVEHKKYSDSMEVPGVKIFRFQVISLTLSPRSLFSIYPSIHFFISTKFSLDFFACKCVFVRVCNYVSVDRVFVYAWRGICEYKKKREREEERETEK